jgi:hypothetical protein
MSNTRSKFAGALNALDTVRAMQADETPEHQDVKAPEHQSSETSKRLSINAAEEKVRTTVYLHPATHKALKHIAIETRRDVSAILQDLADQWLVTQNVKTS